MTAILTVDTAAMQELARRLRAVASQLRAGRAGLGATPAAVATLADPGLIHATGVFFDRWQISFTGLVDDAERLADAVELLARTYQDAESVAERGLSR